MGAAGIPETFFVSAKGDVVGHIIGVVTARQLDEGCRPPSTVARDGSRKAALDKRRLERLSRFGGR